MKEIPKLVYPGYVLGTIIGKSDKTVRRYRDQGIFQSEKNGQYDIVMSMKLYVQHLEEQINLQSKDVDQIEKLKSTEDMRLVRARRKKVELEVEQLERTLIATKEVEAVWNHVIAAFKSKVRAIPMKVGPHLLNLDDLNEVTALLRDSIDEVLMELADYDAEGDAQSREIRVDDNQEN